MKEIKSDKVFEKKIRIYQINRLEELNDFYQKHKREYKNMNEFLVSLIFAGLNSEINFEKECRLGEKLSLSLLKKEEVQEVKGRKEDGTLSFKAKFYR